MKATMQLFLKLLALVQGLFLVSSCGSDATSVDFSEKLVVSMYGDFAVPFDSVTNTTAIANTTMTSSVVAGNSEPKNQTYTFSGMTVTDSEGTVTDLFTDAATEAAEVIIIDRSQIIFEASLTDLRDTIIASMNVTFAASADAKSPADEVLAFTLPSATLVHTENWTVTAAVEKRLKILVQWKNTINADEDAGTETVEASSYTTELIDE
jgi:hypothetical protein